MDVVKSMRNQPLRYLLMISFLSMISSFLLYMAVKNVKTTSVMKRMSTRSSKTNIRVDISSKKDTFIGMYMAVKSNSKIIRRSHHYLYLLVGKITPLASFYISWLTASRSEKLIGITE